MTRQVEFDIALSFAGEDRNYVDQVAHILKSKGISVFYDKFEEANLWGKNLYDYLSDIYRNKALYTIMFVSDNYNKKVVDKPRKTGNAESSIPREPRIYITCKV